MAPVPDDLETLLTDVRKTISDNQMFLKTLKDDTTDVDEDRDESDAPEATDPEEDFEEL